MITNQSNLNKNQLESSTFFSKYPVSKINDDKPQVSKIPEQQQKQKAIEKIKGVSVSANNISADKINYKDLRKKAKTGNFSEFQELNEEQLNKLSKSEKTEYKAILTLKQKDIEKKREAAKKEYETLVQNKSNSINVVNNIQNSDKSYQPISNNELNYTIGNNKLTIQTTNQQNNFNNSSQIISQETEISNSNFTPLKYTIETLKSNTKNAYKQNKNTNKKSKKSNQPLTNSDIIASSMVPMAQTKQQPAPTISFYAKTSEIDRLNIQYKQKPIWRQKFG